MLHVYLIELIDLDVDNNTSNNDNNNDNNNNIEIIMIVHI